MIKTRTRTNQPINIIWCTVEDGILEQVFLVVDKKIQLELKTPTTCFMSLLVVMGAYFAFNLSYDSKQELIFLFIEEFILRLKSRRKAARYRKMCANMMPADCM